MFGMGTGVAPPLWSPDVDFYFNISRDEMQPLGRHRARLCPWGGETAVGRVRRLPEGAGRRAT